MNSGNTVFGIFENVDIPSLGIENVVAKIDTGAYSGALHCSHIEEIVRPNGKKVLRFTPSDNHSHATELTRYFRSNVRSSTGHRVKRYLFDTNIVVKGVEYGIRIGLSNRSDMNYEILIGRRFLSENNILIDTNINQHLDIDRSRKV
jgi:hypothetical protein